MVKSRNVSRISLGDKFDLSKDRVLLTGAQAVVRLTLMQRARDDARGLKTAGYVTGYRGSPIAGLEGQFQRAGKVIEDAGIVFQPGLNEDLAATAIWGAQQAELRGEGKYDGVFGVWYGKGPGVDRSGDVFRHANHAGTSKYGGVLALMGDDHTCESSTSAHQSEFAFLDAMIPVLNPAGVQEILDFGLIGLALSRFAGVWVGIKCVKDNIESTSVVDARLERIEIVTPADYAPPDGGLNIRLGDTPLEREARLHDHKRDAILAFAHANNLDRIVLHGGPAAKIGIVTTGKSYLDTAEALDELGIDEKRAADLGIRLLKIGMVWPLEPQIIERFGDGLETIIVVEEKRSLIETQIKEQLYGRAGAPAVIGKKDENDNSLFHAKGALEPIEVALAVGERILARCDDDALKERLDTLKRYRGNRPSAPEVAMRIPYFCAGCPHNSSTVVPDGARAYAGIGCHYMVQWMDRATEGFTHMGAEGANWIGEAPFSKTRHVFQNIGDGTYIHSGSLAIRAAIAAGVNITYKILFNDAVAMTGGQALDGGMTVSKIANQMAAEGVARIAVVSDEPAKYRDDETTFPRHTTIHHRRELDRVQRDLARLDGVTVLIYDQTCAAEKRRRRKRGLYPDPAKRAVINTDVCEGCGDCGVKSNCVSIVPVETPFGRKRQIDQSTCNKDFSCLEGFCPSFVTVNGGRLRKPDAVAGPAADGSEPAIAALPEPEVAPIDGNASIVVTGVGGTGVVTISAILGQAAFIDGLAFGAIDMAGLAQKGGAVACHVRIARTSAEIHAIRAGLAGADLVLGCDLVVTGSNKVLETIRPGHTDVVLNSHEMITGDFTRDPEFRLPACEIAQAIRERAGAERVHGVDAHGVALRACGDSIASNMFMLGYAFQRGALPLGRAAIEEAIELNGVQVAMNLRAFGLGRLAAHDPAALDELIGVTGDVPTDTDPNQTGETLDRIVARAKDHLTLYQDADYAERYASEVARMAEVERTAIGPGHTRLAKAVARSYRKLLAYKDEYEVARLFTDGTFERRLAKQFEGDYRLTYHLAPPLIARRHPSTGEPMKRAFGPWFGRVLRGIARLKGLRGTRLDPFGYSGERRLERAMIADYEHRLDDIRKYLAPGTYETAIELAELPRRVRGFGHVKRANAEAAKVREQELVRLLRAPGRGPAAAREAA